MKINLTNDAKKYSMGIEIEGALPNPCVIEFNGFVFAYDRGQNFLLSEEEVTHVLVGEQPFRIEECPT